MKPVTPRLPASLRTVRAAALAACALAAVACSNGDDKAAAAASASAAPPKPVLGGKLGAAVAAAEASGRGPSPAASAGNPDGPPESGVFAPGKADKIVAPKAPPKLEVLGEGSEPKVRLSLATGDEQKATMTVAVRNGPQSAMPTIDFDLVAKAEKKGDKAEKGEKKKDKEKAKPEAAAAGEGTPIVIKVARASIAKDQPANIPKEVGDAVAKLKGAEVRYVLAETGAISDMVFGLPKDADPALGSLLQSLGEAVSVATPIVPPKPVGVGGYWIATDRTSAFGIDVVRYRVFKVEKLDGSRPSLSIDVREYAADAQTDLGGAARAKMFIDRFDAQGKGTEQAFGILPKSIDVQERLQARVGQQPGQGQQVFFVQLNAKIR